MLFRCICSIGIVASFYMPPASAAGREEAAYFQRVTVEDGLSQSVVNCALEDHRGFMWFGTMDGLNRYDGKEFRVYRPNPADPSALANGYIWSLYEDRQENLWIGTNGGGLHRFDPAQESFDRYWHQPGDSSSLSDDDVRVVYEDGYGELWVGTHRGGLNRLDRESGSFMRYRADPSSPGMLPHDDIRAIHEDRRGVLWVGTHGGGLCSLDRSNDSFECHRHHPDDPASLSNNHISALTNDESGALWVATAGGLNRFDGERGFHRYLHESGNPATLGSDDVRAVLTDRSGQLWVGTHGGGLSRLDKSTQTFVRHQHDPDDVHSLSIDIVHTLSQSAEGGVWIGTDGGGVNYLNSQARKFSLYRHQAQRRDSLSHDIVMAVHEDQSGALWVGTAGGLDRLNDDTRTFDHQFEEAEVWAIGHDAAGTLWVGTWGAGLHAFDETRGSSRFYRHNPADPASLAHDRVYALAVTSSGTVWIGTEHGLDRLDPDAGVFTHHRHESARDDSLSHDVVRVIHSDRAGRLWVGTGGGGLNRLEGDRSFRVFRHAPTDPHSLSHDYVRSVLEDADGTIWVGTDGGLNEMRPGSDKFLRYTTADGLPSNVVYGIVEDDSDRLWLSTNNGLARFDPATREFTVFDSDDGLQGREFNTGAFCKRENGEVYFGGINGLNAFLPHSVGENSHAPSVVITDFRLFNKSVPIGVSANERVYLRRSIAETESLELSPDDSVVTFEFSVLDFTAPQKNNLAYKMDGLEDEWNYVGERRFATYTTLPAGQYTLRVKGANNDGVWNDEGASLEITVLPPVWDTAWFRLGSGATVCLLVLIGYRLRMRSIEHGRQELEREVVRRTRELHKSKTEIESKNVLLENTLQELEAAKGEIVEQAHKAGMADVASNVLHNVGNILNSARTSATALQEVAHDLRIDGLSRANEKLSELATVDQMVSGSDVRPVRDLARYYSKLEEVFRSDRECLEGNAQRLVEKIDDIVRVIDAQHELAANSSYTEVFSLAEVIDTALQLKENALGRANVAVDVEVAETPHIGGQRTKLLAVLQQLFDNAIDATADLPAGGRRLHVSTQLVEGTAVVRIEDNGRGITREGLTGIFAPQVASMRRGTGGSSLHQCANRVSEMGGKLWAESEGPQRGATLVLRVPLAG